VRRTDAVAAPASGKVRVWPTEAVGTLSTVGVADKELVVIWADVAARLIFDSTGITEMLRAPEELDTTVPAVKLVTCSEPTVAPPMTLRPWNWGESPGPKGWGRAAGGKLNTLIFYECIVHLIVS
jgi:hypothetical protein